MMYNRNEKFDLVRKLDKTAEKNPLLWLPCIVLLTFIMVTDWICDKVKSAFSRKMAVYSANVQIRRKPLALRALAMTLAVSFTFMLVPDLSAILSFNAYAEVQDDFDMYKYIADDIIYSKEDPNDDLNFYSDYAKKTMDFYYNDFKSMAEIWQDCVTIEFKDSVQAWEMTNVILSPEDAAGKMIDAKEYYITIIVDMMNSSFTIKDPTLKILNNKNIKNTTSVYNGFAKLYKEISNSELETLLADDSFTEHGKKVLQEIQKEYLEDNNLLSAGKAASDIFFVLDTLQKPADYVGAFVEYCNVYNTTNEWKECIQYMYDNCDKSNIPLCQALETLIFCSKDIDNCVYQIWKDGITEIGYETYKVLSGKAFKYFLDTVAPYLSAIDIGKAIGKPLTNLLCGTDKIVEEYYIIKSYCDIISLLRSAYGSAKKSYINSKSSKDAQVFISYVNMYFAAEHVGNKYGKEFADAICNGGILNKILYSKDQYESFCKHYDNFEKYLDWANENVLSYWINNLYWDRPDLYEEYAPLIKTNSFIDPTRVEFEKDTVEWGLEDVEFYGAKYTVYPVETTNKEVIITSSDESVATLDNYGNVRVFREGTCQITVTTYTNDFVYDTLDVTVVEGHGADGLTIPEIIPITPEIVEAKKYNYTISNGEVTITKYLGNEEDVVIPDKIEGLPVVLIGEYAFKSKNITSVTIPNGVTEIGYEAFKDCNKLNTVVLPHSIKKIKAYCFYNCTGLENIDLPSELTYIGISAFYSCKSLTQITLPESLTDIGYGAFCNCDELKEITIPAGLANFINSEKGDGYNITSGVTAFFAGCDNLRKATFANGINSTSQIMRECDGLQIVVLPNTIEQIGSYSFYKCTSLKQIVFPSTLTKIEYNAFYGCAALNDITIPSNVHTIQRSAFSDCSGLENISFSDGLEIIEQNAFSNCISLKQIVFPSTLTEIGYSAFYGCAALNDITIPSNVHTIQNSTFSDCSALENISFSDGLEIIEQNAFSNCISLGNTYIPKTVKEINYGAFSNCTNASIFYPYDLDYSTPNDTKINIGWKEKENNEVLLAITGSTMSVIEIPEKISIPMYFSDYTVTEIDKIRSSTAEKIILPNSVKVLGKETFRYCSMLKEVILPNQITVIPQNAFYECRELEKIELPSTIIYIEDSAFEGCQSLKSILIPNNVTEIKRYAFWKCENLENVYFEHNSKLKKISGYAFVACPSLNTIYIPQSVNEIDSNAFAGELIMYYPIGALKNDYAGNNSFKRYGIAIGYYTHDDKADIGGIVTPYSEITIPEKINLQDGNGDYTVIKLHDYAFSGDKNIEKVILPNSISTIGGHAFQQLNNLKEVNIPHNLEYLGDYAFAQCPNITNINLPDSVTYIGRNAFWLCTNLTNIKLSSNITEINIQCFDKCEKLESIIIPDGVTTIKSNSFEYCYNLKKIVIPRSVTKITSAFYQSDKVVIYGYKNSYAEEYANTVKIQFIALDDMPTDTISSLIAKAPENSVLAIDTSKYGTQIFPTDISTAKAKNLTLGIVGDGYKWLVNSVNLLDGVAVNFSITSPSGAVNYSKEFDTPFDSSKDFSISNPAESTLTYYCGTENAGKTANVFTVNGKTFEYSTSAVIGTDGNITFSTNGANKYFVAIADITITELAYVQEHIHSYGTVIKYDETLHWYECECGVTSEKNAHSENSGIVTTQPTTISTGIKTYSCKVCGYTTRTEEIPMLDEEHDHLFSDEWKYNSSEHWHECNCGERTDVNAHSEDEGVTAIAATTISDGLKIYSCQHCGYTLRMEVIPAIEEHTHIYGTEWNWDQYSHWHECDCGDKSDFDAHIPNIPAATETTDKVCTVCGYVIEKATSEHTHSFVLVWKSDSTSHWRECSCGVRTDITNHNSDKVSITVEPTATVSGTRTYSCSICGYVMRTETIPATGDYIPSNPTYPSSPVIPSNPPTNSSVSDNNLPQVQGSNKAGWDSVIEQILLTPDGRTVTVNMNGTEELPKNVVECLMDRNINLSLIMNGGMKWTINGLSITNPKTVDMGVRKKTKTHIPDELLESVSMGNKSVQVVLDHNGSFGFTATLTIDLGEKYNGMYANLFYYNSKAKELEFMSNGIIKNGRATLVFTHASEYAIVISKEPLGDYQDVSSAAGTTADSIPIDFAAPVTDGVTIPAIKIPQFPEYSTKKRRYRILRKRRLDDLVFVF